MCMLASFLQNVRFFSSIQEMFFNAVLAELVARKGVSKESFKLNHPGGSIGIKLSTSS